jgi:hypothetical protein
VILCTYSYKEIIAYFTFFSIYRSVEAFIANEPEPGELLLRRAIQLLETRIANMESNLHGTMNSISRDVTELSEKVYHMVSGRVSLQFVRSEERTISRTSQLPANSSVPRSHDNNTAANSNDTPNYRMSRGVKTIPDL